MIGLVLHQKSPRFVTPARAKVLADRARQRAEVVMLTVDVSLEALGDLIAAIKPDWLQMHGGETPEEVAAVRRDLAVKVMKALPVAEADDLAAARRYAGADRLLFDAKPPKGADRPGGHGRPFDWTLLAGFDAGKPVILSGGLTPANVAEAIAVTGAMGVDVSSGVESAPGKKDAGLIRAFLAAARQAGQAGVGEPPRRRAS